MTDREILRSIKQLAQEECANYQSGNCLMTDAKCHVINQSYSKVCDGAIDCDYFTDAVLPLDWTLRDLVNYVIFLGEDTAEQLPPNMRLCENCNMPFTATHQKQKYCKTCGKIINRKKTRERKRQKKNKELV